MSDKKLLTLIKASFLLFAISATFSVTAIMLMLGS